MLVVPRQPYEECLGDLASWRDLGNYFNLVAGLDAESPPVKPDSGSTY